MMFVILAGCGNPSPTPSASASPQLNNAEVAAYATSKTPAPGARGGKLVVGTTAMATQLNPFYTYAAEDMAASLPILRGCAGVTSDGKYVPDLCASLPSSANGDIAIDGQTFSLTLHLRKGLLWSDGQPLTMRDLEYTWRWAIDPGQSGCARCSTGWPSIDAIAVSPDGLTATVHFSGLFGGWLEWLTNPIMPRHYLSTIPVGEAATRSYPPGAAGIDAPVSGPFAIASIDANRIEYARNPRWQSGVSAGHQGNAYLDGLELMALPDAAAEIAAFQGGRIDLALGLHDDSYAAFGAIDPKIGQLSQTPLWAYEHLGLNTDPANARGNGLSDPGVRMAIAELVDKESAATAAGPGAQVFVACSPAPPGIWYRKEESCPPYDVAPARALLAASGWAPDPAGWLAKDGREMDLQLCTTAGRSTRLDHLGQLEQAFRSVGIHSHVLAVDGPSVFFAIWETTTASTDCSLARGNYDISEFGWTLSGMPSRDWFPPYSSSERPELVHGFGNDTRFSDPAADAALNRLSTDVSLESQLSDAQVVQDSVVHAGVEVPLFYWSAVTGVGIHAGNWLGFNPSLQGPTWDVEDWFYRP